MKKTVKLTIPPQYTDRLKAAAKAEGGFSPVCSAVIDLLVQV